MVRLRVAPRTYAQPVCQGTPNGHGLRVGNAQRRTLAALALMHRSTLISESTPGSAPVSRPDPWPGVFAVPALACSHIARSHDPVRVARRPTGALQHVSPARLRYL